MDEIATKHPKKNTPQIVTLGTQYFIIAEQDVLMETKDMNDAIFIWFLSHYVYDIKYEKGLTSVCHLFKTTLFQLYDQTSRSAKYNSTVRDLKLMFGKYYK